MLVTTCPHCGRRAELEDDRRGRPVRCEHCGEGFRAPLDDNERGVAALSASTPADVVALVAAVLAVLGVLATAAALLVVLTGGTLPVGGHAIMFAAILPAAVIAATWFVARKASSAVLVLTGRIAAYLWIMGLIVLVIKIR